MAKLFLCTLFLASYLCLASFTEFVEVALAAFDKAWDTWEKTTGQKEYPSLSIQFLKPSIGTRISPNGMHPRKYMHQLPDLKGYDIEGAKISYINAHGVTTCISSEADWLSFWNAAEIAPDGRLDLRVWLDASGPEKKGLWERVAQHFFEKMRNSGKSHMWEDTIDEGKLSEEQKYLESQGYTEFESKALVFEELGYDKETWPALVDELVEAGIPEVWGKTLKLGAKAKRGAVKSLAVNSHKDGVRSMYYMRFQVLPDGEGGVDGLFAIYQLSAKAKEQETGIKTEQSFKRFVELDAHREWNQKVRQFMVDNDSNAHTEM